MIKEVLSVEEMKGLGRRLGERLCGGEVIELTGDIGAGKTTLVKGIAEGLDIDDPVQSPSFTINRVYKAKSNLRLSHYDFYRLNEAGIMSSELIEDMHDPSVVVVIEWGGVVDGILPDDRLTVDIATISDQARKLRFTAGGGKSHKLLEGAQL